MPHKDPIRYVPLESAAPGQDANLTPAPFVIQEEGWIRSIVPLPPGSGTIPRGALWAHVSLLKGRTAGELAMRETLWRGYLQENAERRSPSSYPNFPIGRQDSILIRLIQGTAAIGRLRWAVGISDQPGPGSPRIVDMPPGETAIYTEHVNIANEAAQGASNIERIYTPADETWFEVLTARIVNLDTVARAALVRIDDGTNVISMLHYDSSVAVGAEINAPTATLAGAPIEAGANFARAIVTGANRLLLQSESVADSQDATFAVTMRIHGLVPRSPTRTSVGAGVEVVTVNTNTLDYESD